MNREEVRRRIRERIAEETVHSDPPALQRLKQLPMRVACYARCAVDDISQVSSAELFAIASERYVRSVPAWSFAGSYVDQCLSSVPPENRSGFQQMKKQVRDYDLILCRSVARLGSALPAILSQVEWFRAKGIGYYFESEDLFTLDDRFPQACEMLCKLAEEESIRKSRALITPIQWRMELNDVSDHLENGKQFTLTGKETHFRHE